MANIKLLPVFFVFIALISCRSSQTTHSPIPETGMFKVTILYPSGEDKNFDIDYYQKKHMPMVAAFLGKNLKFYEIDKGIAGRTLKDKAPFVAVGYFFINDVAEYNKAVAQNIDTIRNDIKKFTNIQPTIQVSEIEHVAYGNVK